MVSTFLGIPLTILLESYLSQWLCVDLLLCSSFLTPSSVTVMMSISGYGSPSGSGSGMLGSSWVKTDWYYLCRISALSLGVLKRRPLSLNSATPVESVRRDLCSSRIVSVLVVDCLPGQGRIYSENMVIFAP